MSHPYDKRTLERYAAAPPYDKKGRSVRELALLKWFTRTSYVALPDAAIDAYADVLFERMNKPCT